MMDGADDQCVKCGHRGKKDLHDVLIGNVERVDIADLTDLGDSIVVRVPGFDACGMLLRHGWIWVVQCGGGLGCAPGLDLTAAVRCGDSSGVNTSVEASSDHTWHLITAVGCNGGSGWDLGDRSNSGAFLFFLRQCQASSCLGVRSNRAKVIGLRWLGVARGLARVRSGYWRLREAFFFCVQP